MPIDGQPRSATAPINPIPGAYRSADLHLMHPGPRPRPLQQTTIGRRGQLMCPCHPLHPPGAPTSPRDPGPPTCRAGSAGDRTPPRGQLGNRANPCPTRRPTTTAPRTTAPNRPDRPDRPDRPRAPPSPTIACQITPPRAGAPSIGPRRPSRPRDGCRRRRPSLSRPARPPNNETSSRPAQISTAQISTARISTAVNTGVNTGRRRTIRTATKAMAAIRNQAPTPAASPRPLPASARHIRTNRAPSPAGRAPRQRLRRHRDPNNGSNPRHPSPSPHGSPRLPRTRRSSDMPRRPT